MMAFRLDLNWMCFQGAVEARGPLPRRGQATFRDGLPHRAQSFNLNGKQHEQGDKTTDHSTNIDRNLQLAGSGRKSTISPIYKKGFFVFYWPIGSPTVAAVIWWATYVIK